MVATRGGGARSSDEVAYFPSVLASGAVLDTGGGLSSVTVTTADNVTVSTPSFTPGTNAPVTFTATKQNQALPARVAIVLTDVAGNQSSCI